MLLRKINNVKGQRLRIGTMAVDPHGELACLYEQERGEFLLMEADSFLKHFEFYRHDYLSENRYDNRDPLPCRAVFKSEQILEMYPTIKFSERSKDTQCIVIYFCTFIEVLKLQADSGKLLFRVIYKLASEILEANIINQDVYASLYDGSLMHIDLKTLEKIKKEEECRRIVRASEHARKNLGMMESMRLEESEQGRIWQSFCGNLMRDKKVLSCQFQDNFDYSNSFQEYLGKEVCEKHPVKYEMSLCRGYIIGSSFGRIASPNSPHTLKARWANWATVCELDFKPEINPFWKAYQDSTSKEENYGFQSKSQSQCSRSRSRSPTPIERPEKPYPSLTDKILVAAYNQEQNALKIAWIVVKKNKMKRVAQGEFLKYRNDYKSILNVGSLKRPIVQLKWIGLTQLLFIDSGFKLYYLQFDEDNLK